MLDEDIKDVAKPSLPDGINSGRITTVRTIINILIQFLIKINYYLYFSYQPQ